MKHGAAIVFFIGIHLASSEALADEPALRQCYIPTPLPELFSTLDPADDSLRIRSRYSEIRDNQTASFSGGVEITHRDTLLTAPRADFSSLTQSMSADGGIQYFNSAMQVSGSSFQANLLENKAILSDASYQFTTQTGRGYAQELTATEHQVLLNQAHFTTCPEQDNSWALHAHSINIEAEEGWGEAHHAVFRIKDIPVFYLPYITFPVNDQRKSGLLLPKTSSSQKLGVEFELPYYFNLAENYDLTLTPRYMSKRGTQLKSEFRYLTEEHQGRVQLEYLGSDNDKPAGFGKRYLGHLSHRSDFTSRIRGYIDFTDVSDDSYLSELSSDYNNQSDTQLYREAAVSYYGDQVHSQLKIQGFEVLGNYNKAYTALPELSLSSARPISLYPMMDFSWEAQYAHFRNNTALISNADRIHLEPTLNIPFITPALEVNAEASLLYTYYQQHTDGDPQAIQDTVSRTLPKIRIYSRLNLEREYDWFGEQALQTFEPQIQYLYIPYRDQSQIGLFDTTRLQDDYFGLFRENRYSGLDRINEANQLTVGWTTRLYDNTDNELFRFSLGQIFFFGEPTQKADEFTDDLTSTESMLAAEMVWHWYRKWYFSSAVQYDIDSKQLIKSNASMDYRANEKNLLQLNHRYSREVSGLEIQQLGMLGTMPLTDNLQIVGSYYRDITNHRMIEANIGLQYESCCWAVRVVARRQIQTNLDFLPETFNRMSQLDSGISLQFVVKGFGDKAGFGVSDMLSNGIFSYRRPYLLTN
ncbi:LPS assembly protein LptD [Chromatiaceae bacterium AAb-1]|nr:LPS assembly protein LptD [Chromatiaceae bacterium AAb-1]